VWGVQTELLIDFILLSAAAVDADPHGAVRIGPNFVRLTYMWNNTLIFGDALGQSELALADWPVSASPIPPVGLRENLRGPFGLVVNMSTNQDIANDLQASVDAGQSGPWSFSVAWRLPSCSVTLVESTITPRKLVECGNRGVCNYEDGKCTCFGGYGGAACERGFDTI